MVDFTSLLLLGAFSGFIAGLLGVGGGLILVPALLYLLADNVPQAVLMHTAVGTTLLVIVFTSIASVRAHHQHGAIVWHAFKKLTPTILLGAFSGALLAQVLSFDFMRIFFAVFEMIAALILWFGVSASAQVVNLSKRVWSIIGYCIGLVSTIVGIGGGTLTTPFLIYTNIAIKNAIATSAAVGMPIAMAGAVGFMIIGWSAQNSIGGLGFIHTQAFMSIVITSVLFAPLGARVAHRTDGAKLKKLFAVFLAFLGLAVFIF